MGQLKLFIVVRANDWDGSLRGWHFPALQIPGARLVNLYAGGAMVDPKQYHVNRSTQLIRPGDALIQRQLSGEIVAEVDIRRSLISKLAATLLVVLTALVCISGGAGVLYAAGWPAPAITGVPTPRPKPTATSNGGTAPTAAPGPPSGARPPLSATETARSEKWAQLGHSSSNIEWKIAAVEPLSDRIRVKLKLRNKKANETTSFNHFKGAPLRMIDSNGTYRGMIDTGERPHGVFERHSRWYIAGSQVIETFADFEPPAAGATGGKIIYMNGEYGESLVFSLLR